MKAVILNSGVGSRMGEITKKAPKCLTELVGGETILYRQVRQLVELGIKDLLITTGPFPGEIESYVQKNFPSIQVRYIRNERYSETNYIYSLYLAREELDTDILLMHGDLVFEDAVLREVKESCVSCMVCDSMAPLPEKDFKAMVQDNRIWRVGIDIFERALAAQPLYKLLREDLQIWMDEIAKFCEKGTMKVYAENAFNEVSNRCAIYPLDIRGRLCGEIDDLNDWEAMNKKLRALMGI